MAKCAAKLFMTRLHAKVFLQVTGSDSIEMLTGLISAGRGFDPEDLAELIGRHGRGVLIGASKSAAEQAWAATASLGLHYVG